MNLVVGSCFRQSSDAHIARYARQIRALHAAAAIRGDVLHVISVWGDSTDRTAERVAAALSPLHLHSFQVIERSHGFPNYGSSEHPDRLAGFAYAANGVFEIIGEGADVVGYVESDLIWSPADLYAAVDQLDTEHQIIALPTFCKDTTTFYDLWAFRDVRGVNYGPLAPYGPINPSGLTEMGSVGGCLALTGAAARRYRCSAEAALVGLCHAARRDGLKIWADWRHRVVHP